MLKSQDRESEANAEEVGRAWKVLGRSFSNGHGVNSGQGDVGKNALFKAKEYTSDEGEVEIPGRPEHY